MKTLIKLTALFAIVILTVISISMVRVLSIPYRKLLPKNFVQIIPMLM